jgi:hypothetical protein
MTPWEKRVRRELEQAAAEIQPTKTLADLQELIRCRRCGWSPCMCCPGCGWAPDSWCPACGSCGCPDNPPTCEGLCPL